MQHVLPGIHGFPMSQRPLLHTRETTQAVRAIRQLVEPFRFTWGRQTATMDVQVTGAMLERVKIFGVRHGAPVLVSSNPLQSYYIILPLQGEVVGRIQDTNYRASAGEALVFPAGARLHAHWDLDCVAMVLSIAREELEAEFRGLAAAPDRPLLPAKLLLRSGVGRSFLNILGCLCADCDLQQDGDSLPRIRQSLQQALLVSLLELNRETSSDALQIERASTRRRRAGVARAVDYLHQNAHRKVEVDELAKVAYLSLRSLQVGFLECFGMGPMSYGKRARLLKAREELLCTDRRDVNITDISARWGFACDNTFRRLYRQNFGELPSQTLN